MPSPLYIITPEHSEAAGVVASASVAAAAGAPVSNLLKPQPTDFYKSSTTAAVNIDIDLVSAKAVACAALLFTSLESGTTWSVLGATSQANLTSSPGYNSGTLTLAGFFDQANITRRHLIHIPASVQTFRWWRFAISAQTAAFSAGCVILGPVWNPEVELGFQRGYTLLNDPARTDGGNLIATMPNLEPPVEATLTIQAVTEAIHEEQLQRIGRLRISGKPILFVSDLATANYTQQRVLYGLITAMSQIVVEQFNLWKCRMNLSGMI